MSKNIVLCFDGTNNQFGPQKTNIVRLLQVLHREPGAQHVYYDPGVGTLHEPGALTRIGKRLSVLLGLAFGAGLTWKVQEAYEYLMDFWEPGDRVFLFGFSRGAYSARVLAGWLHSLGLMSHGSSNMIPYAMRLYKAVRQVGESPGEHWKLCDEFRSTFARPVPGSGSDDRRFPVHFLGVWDTVSSVGWIWDPVTFPFTARNPSIQIVRHAVSIDERRAFFRQNLMKEAEQQDFRELWFPGVHCDVGGGYPDNQGELWLSPYLWILDEAIGAGMMVDTERRREFIAGSHPQPWNDRLHKSLRSLWWIAEFLPKMSGRPASPRRSPRLGLGRRRVIKEGAIMHASTLLRIREADYEPPNLSNDFVARVRRLSEVPDALPFSH